VVKEGGRGGQDGGMVDRGSDELLVVLGHGVDDLLLDERGGVDDLLLDELAGGDRVGLGVHQGGGVHERGMVDGRGVHERGGVHQGRGVHERGMLDEDAGGRVVAHLRGERVARDLGSVRNDGGRRMDNLGGGGMMHRDGGAGHESAVMGEQLRCGEGAADEQGKDDELHV